VAQVQVLEARSAAGALVRVLAVQSVAGEQVAARPLRVCLGRVRGRHQIRFARVAHPGLYEAGPVPEEPSAY
jgi:hypothetical protein